MNCAKPTGTTRLGLANHPAALKQPLAMSSTTGLRSSEAAPTGLTTCSGRRPPRPGRRPRRSSACTLPRHLCCAHPGTWPVARAVHRPSVHPAPRLDQSIATAWRRTRWLPTVHPSTPHSATRSPPCTPPLRTAPLSPPWPCRSWSRWPRSVGFSHWQHRRPLIRCSLFAAPRPRS